MNKRRVDPDAAQLERDTLNRIEQATQQLRNELQLSRREFDALTGELAHVKRQRDAYRSAVDALLAVMAVERPGG